MKKSAFVRALLSSTNHQITQDKSRPHMHQVIGIQTLTLAWSKDWALLATAWEPLEKSV